MTSSSAPWQTGETVASIVITSDFVRNIAVNPNDARVRKLFPNRSAGRLSKVQRLIVRLLRHIKPDVMIDVGSNYGECVFVAPNMCRTKFYVFEPNPNLLPFLARSIEANSDLNVTLLPVCIGDKVRQNRPFYFNLYWSGMSTIFKPKTRIRNYVEISIPVTSLDSNFSAQSAAWRTIVVKIDVEGAEPMVLDGARALFETVPNIFCVLEFDTKYLSQAGITPEDFCARLARLGTLYLIQGNRLVAIDGYEELRAQVTAKSRVHEDLLLVRTQAFKVQGDFQSHFLQVNTNEKKRSFDEFGANCESLAN